MKRIKYYSHEIYTVITILWITLSALFVIPGISQKIILIYAFVFLIHEWEENNYPGGFFDFMFGEVMNIQPVPSGRKLREARIYVYILLLVLTLVPYFLKEYVWLVLPIVYLGFLEGFSHTMSIRIFKLDRKYSPGMVTAIVEFCLSVCSLSYIISNHMAVAWQYVAAVFILIAGLLFMALNGMRENNIDFREIPGKMKSRLQQKG